MSKVYIVTDDLKEKAKIKEVTTVVEHTVERNGKQVLVDGGSGVFVAPVTGQYFVYFTWVIGSVYDPNSIQYESLTFDWEKGSKHQYTGTTIDDYKNRNYGTSLYTQITIALVSYKETITTPPPPLPSYKTFIKRDGKLIPTNKVEVKK